MPAEPWSGMNFGIAVHDKEPIVHSIVKRSDGTGNLPGVVSSNGEGAVMGSSFQSASVSPSFIGAQNVSFKAASPTHCHQQEQLGRAQVVGIC
jgi:hypothetical protein